MDTKIINVKLVELNTSLWTDFINKKFQERIK